ncbi:hypothetical protein D0T50_04270 [Bacteroides sp. 214]|uniref:WbqC family protein n=1 Tax=Bacteroides sp. 214 TaxID=2302935 RepID=UPI0013CFB2EE|nr:WbqC family protein [Bacteroides sp. 214]NDW12104.1 hypothetical protein [Bacteroides sp. 214]
MNSIYLSSAYLAPVQYYAKLLTADNAFIEVNDHYMKQTYRNRCNIAGPEGVLPLSIPIVRPATKCKMKEIQISDHGNWRHLHWNALESAYNNTPFFEYYKDDFQPFYEKKYAFLADFNESLLRLILGLLDMDVHLQKTLEYKEVFNPNEVDLREVIHPKKDYLLTDPGFIPQSYYQVFEAKNGFLPNLSIVDLLFNMGPESLLILQASNISE